MSKTGIVLAVSRSHTNTFSKFGEPSIQLITGQGVKGDAHAGATVRHRSRVAINPHQPNLRQVHLIHDELQDELRNLGFDIQPGDLGENVTTRGISLLTLPTGTLLRLGAEAVIEVKGLRSPCAQIEHFQSGLLSAVLARDDSGKPVSRLGVMGVVIKGGVVKPGDAIEPQLPPGPHVPLEKV